MLTLIFYECEHVGDLEYYEPDINLSGGELVEHQFNEDGESAIVKIKTDDNNGFLEKFRATESYGFCHLSN
jgi:hypothetical protein